MLVKFSWTFSSLPGCFSLSLTTSSAAANVIDPKQQDQLVPAPNNQSPNHLSASCFLSMLLMSSSGRMADDVFANFISPFQCPYGNTKGVNFKCNSWSRWFAQRLGFLTWANGRALQLSLSWRGKPANVIINHRKVICCLQQRSEQASLQELTYSAFSCHLQVWVSVQFGHWKS